MNLGARLRLARKQRKLDQEKLATMVPGASQAMISALEVRDSETTTLLFGFADVLQINPRWLLTGEGVSGLDGPLLGDPSDPMLHQLIALYGDLSPEGRDGLIGNANRLFSQEHPEKSGMCPLTSSKKRPLAERALWVRLWMAPYPL